MIKRIIKLLILIIFVGLVAGALYIFELPPFDTKPADLPQDISVIDDDSEKVNVEEANLPPELQETDRVARTKTYEESIKRAQLLEENGFITLAISEYQYAYQQNNQSTAPLYKMGQLFLQENEYSKAQSIFETILKIEPNSLDAEINLGRSLLGQRKIQEARDIFDALQGNTMIALYYQGLTMSYFEDHAGAKSKFEKVVSMRDQNAALADQAQSFLDAYNEYDFNDGSPTVHLKVLLARSYVEADEFQMAIPLLFDVTKEKLDYRDAWILLGYAYLQLEEYPDSIESLERAKILDPQKAETNFFLGLAYYSINDYEKAAENLQSAKEFGFQPQIQVDQKLAEIYLQLQNYEKSAENYKNVLALRSQSIDYYVRPIWLYIDKLNNPGEALELAQQGLEEHPNSAMSHNLMAWALISDERFDRAEAYLAKAMELDPELDAVYLNYGILFENKGESNRALNFYKKAHKMGNGSGVSNVAADRYNKLLAQVNNYTIQANTFGN